MASTVSMARKPFYRRDPLTTVALTAAVFLLSQIVAAIIIGLYPALQNWTDGEATLWLKESVTAQFAYILIAEVLAIGMILKLIERAQVTRSRIGLVMPKLKDLGYAFIAYGLYFLAYLAVILIAQAVLPSLNVDQEQQIGFETAYNNAELVMTFASLVILPPLAEEIIFRGFLFTSLRAKFRLRYTVIITSVLFGLAHLQFGSDAPLLWVAAIDTFVLSCFLCYLRERTNSLWPPIFLHAIKNAVAFMLLFGPRFIN